MTLISTLGQLGKGNKDISTLITTPSYLLQLDKHSKGLQKKYDDKYSIDNLLLTMFFAKFRIDISEIEEFAIRLVFHTIIFI